MANEVIELPRTEYSSNMPVTREAMDTLKRQRELLREFVQSQLVEGIDNDYAVIPGTNKKSLLKPGAEKLARLFALGIRVTLVERIMERKDNFALFTYKAEIYVLTNPDVVVASCEATSNSQEKKYKERTVYVNGAKTKEETPIFDILNTLQKMCQKRAIVGAVILAVGGSDFFTQDIESKEDLESIGGQVKAEVKVVKASVTPAVKSAASQNQTTAGSAPIHCDKPMMVSKYDDKEFGPTPWWCTVCKAKMARG